MSLSWSVDGAEYDAWIAWRWCPWNRQQLIHLVERRIGGNKPLLKGAAFQPPPRDENDWVERINAMTVRELSSALTS